MRCIYNGMLLLIHRKNKPLEITPNIISYQNSLFSQPLDEELTGLNTLHGLK